MTRVDDMDMASTGGMEKVPTTGTDTRENTPSHSSILYLSIDKVGYASDIGFEAEQFWFGCRVRPHGERHGIGVDWCASRAQPVEALVVVVVL